MASGLLDRVLNALAVRLHAASVCAIQQGWQLAYAPFDAITVHYVLHGSGVMQVGGGPALPFAPQSVAFVPAGRPHVIGTGGAAARTVNADEHCSLLFDGLVQFTAGDGASSDIVLVCGMIPAAFGHALGPFDLLREPLVEDIGADPALGHAFDLMRAEVANPGIGTQAMAEVLMKQCLIALMRRHVKRDDGPAPIGAALQQPRLARAVLAVVEAPGQPHSVASLAAVAGMSRASFAEHFARAFEQGPMQYVQAVRLHVAARLLATTDLPLKVIGHSVGYSAPAAFTRAFRTRYGADPLGYRATHIGR